MISEIPIMPPLSSIGTPNTTYSYSNTHEEKTHIPFLYHNTNQSLSFSSIIENHLQANFLHYSPKVSAFEVTIKFISIIP